ncbi:GNAT family N-acetyltransferase [Pseudogulbenkiania ferrooxidans]|uniref:GCN5-related N-acetyltransferase n=1 Tax=Pseudogulbenkiania ferrooxidans 2002 TaxID=279714 RepID=B9Z7S9_9NEIS|nr:GNAT family N-acetyltransferase [Pseudogulbenkiania ferrooxidans]EEG07215.1 GCN5-related N-acetyltransferase [Pseudogulbenkiania ferrooxidans 2002]
MHIRDARLADLPPILAIYNDVIATSTAVYCDLPSTLEERQAWFEGRRAQGYPVLVAEYGDEVVGFASFGDFRAFPGFRYTVEHSVHIHRDHRGRGIGEHLLLALLPRALALGKHVMVGGVDAANEGSVRFHERLGFTQVGHMPQVGYKFGRWLDLVFLQRYLDAPDSPRD